MLARPPSPTKTFCRPAMKSLFSFILLECLVFNKVPSRNEWLVTASSQVFSLEESEQLGPAMRCNPISRSGKPSFVSESNERRYSSYKIPVA